MSKRFLITIGTLLVISVAAGVAIFFAKGYTFNTKEGKVLGTGIISITSVPDAASVFIDGHLTTATNATIASLPPKEYDVKVIKEGFIPWEKKVKVSEGLVSDLKLTLFPAIPTIYPLTYSGVKNPTLSPDGGKLGFVVPALTGTGVANKKAGIWIWNLDTNQPIAFARSAQPHQIAKSGPVDYSTAELKWSSDSKQLLATIGDNNYLLEDSGLNSDPRDITPVLQATLKSWDDDNLAKEKVRVLNIKAQSIRKIASDSAIVRWSPDETKLLYRTNKLADKEATSSAIKSGFKVLDIETNKEYDIPDARNQTWLPDSRHIVLVEDGAISVTDFDGTNKAVIYAGNFVDSFVFAWPDSSRLVIISSFPTPTASEPNLYGINLK